MAAGDPASSDVRVAAEDCADGRLVTVSGRVDHTNSDTFLTALGAEADRVAKGGGMVVDLAGLEFITSAGLRALFLTNKRLAEAGRIFVVTGLKGVVKEVFRISNFDAILNVAGGVRAGLEQISPEAAAAYRG